MSGGSFDYLYSKCDISEIVSQTSSMEQIRRILTEKGYADIAEDVDDLVKEINESTFVIESLFDSLKPVFKAVEYYESNDYDDNNLTEDLENYRKGKS